MGGVEEDIYIVMFAAGDKVSLEQPYLNILNKLL